jgi:hypothetical protein
LKFNEELWRITKQKPIEIRIKRRKWNQIGYTSRKEAVAIKKLHWIGIFRDKEEEEIGRRERGEGQ